MLTPKGVLWIRSTRWDPWREELARNLHDQATVFDVKRETASKRHPVAAARLDWFDVLVYNGALQAEFGLLPAYRSKLVSAVLSMPNPAHPSYEFVLPQGGPNTDWLIWDSECRYSVWWEHNFGTPQPGDYGQYTLTLKFSDGAQEVYTWTLEQVPVTPAAITGGSVNDDGSANVSWNRQTTADQYYQVRVRDTAGKEYCRVGTWLNAEEAYLSPYDLRCLEEGIPYRWVSCSSK